MRTLPPPPLLPPPPPPTTILQKAAGGVPTAPPVSLHGQLLWREWFTMCSHVVPNFDRIAGNPLCRQIAWDADADKVAAWREARTGFPWIDAAMTQLRQEVRGPG
jgi:cryptochrome